MYMYMHVCIYIYIYIYIADLLGKLALATSSSSFDKTAASATKLGAESLPHLASQRLLQRDDGIRVLLLLIALVEMLRNSSLAQEDRTQQITQELRLLHFHTQSPAHMHAKKSFWISDIT